MTKRSIFNALLAIGVASLLASGVFAQGKHGGKKHGGDHGNRGGDKHEKKWDGGGKPEKQWNGNRGDDDRGKGKAWGRQRAYDGSREIQQQIRQQQRQDDWAFWQQRQNDKFARKQQKQFEKDIRKQQADIERYQRQQERFYERRYDRPRQRHDNGLHLGWYKNGKAYNNGVPWARDRAFDRDRRRAEEAGRRIMSVPYGYDPIVTYLPAYQEPYYAETPREYFVRSLISSFFNQQPVGQYYQPYEVYEVRPSYAYQQPYRYSNATYSPIYYNDEPYYDEPYYSDYDALNGLGGFGGGSLKSSLLNLGLGLLQGFLGTGYSQGLYDGAYARDVYGPRYVNTYQDPYEAPAAYYSPYASSLADQRQLFEEGYRLGYEDAMRDRAAYENTGAFNTGDLITEFLAASLIDRL